MTGNALSVSVTQHVREINALVPKLEHAERKADEYYRAIGEHIAAIKRERPDDWKEIVREQCDLGRSRAYELLSIADGTKTPEQVRADSAERKRLERERESVTVTDDSSGMTAPEWDDHWRAYQQREATMREALAEVSEHRGIVTGVAKHPYAERGHDLYETPAPATYALLSEEKFTGTIWEPANGRGAISRVLRATGHRVVCTDLIDYGVEDAKSGVDFLKQESAPKGVKAIITNPPFRLADDFVRHALELVPRVAMLLRLAALCGIGRTDIMDGAQLARVYPFANRLPMMHRDGRDGDRTESSAIDYAWFLWDREHRGRATLRRILCEGE
jgi:hypothetical protein